MRGLLARLLRGLRPTAEAEVETRVDAPARTAAANPTPPWATRSETSPWLERGRTRLSGGAGGITGADYRRVLEAVGSAGAVEWTALGDARRGVAIRVDLTEGLTESAIRMAAIDEATGVRPARGLSLVAAGDLCVFMEGDVRIDPRVWDLVRRVAAASNELFALNELADVLLASLADPWRIYASLARRFDEAGVPFRGLVTPFGDDPAIALNLLLLHDGWRTMPESVMAGYGVESNDLKFAPASREALEEEFDWLDGIDVRPAPSRIRVYSRRLRRSIDPGHEIRRHTRADVLVVSGGDGWRVTDRMVVARTCATDELVERLPAWAASGTVAIVCDDRDCAREARPVPAGALRALPHPFHHYLAINSDVDWSSFAQVEHARRRLQNELGLHVAGSFYAFSSAGTGVSALVHAEAPARNGRRVPAGTDTRPRMATVDGIVTGVARWFAAGALDTFHAWLDSTRRVALTRRETGDWRWPDHAGPPSDVAGFLVTSTASLVGARLVIHAARTPVQTESDAEPAPPATSMASIAPTAPDDAGRHHAYFACLDGTHGVLRHAGWTLHVELRDEHADVLSVEANNLCPVMMRAAVDVMVAQGIAPLVATAHGGGFGALALANLHNAAAAGRAPADSVHDIDRTSSPYHLRPALTRLGVRFFCPVGGIGASLLRPVEDLLEPVTLRDGTPSWTFLRFISTRHTALGFPERWRHDRNVSHGPAMGFQLSDVLQRMRWLEPGHGGILYTHLGHHPGNQRCDRLAWSEETHEALAQLATHYHDDDAHAPAPFRLWVAPAASVLLFAAVRGDAERHLEVDGSRVHLRSWEDERLGTRVPDLERFGAKLLHGVTVYVERSADARVEIDGRSVECFTRNGADETGRESITFVDDSAPRLLLTAPAVRSVVATDAGIDVTDGPRWQADTFAITPERSFATVRWTIFPVPLAAATHWSLELAWTGPGRLAVELEDGLEAVYAATVGDDGHRGAHWTVDHDIADSRWQRHVLSFAARRAHPHGYPQSITAIGVRLSGVEPVATCRIRSVCLLRPAPALRPIAAPRRLGGTVGGLDGRWRRPWFVRCDGPGVERRVRIDDAHGLYEIDGLPPDVSVACRVTDGEREFISPRGPVAVMSTDHLDWDFVVPPDLET